MENVLIAALLLVIVLSVNWKKLSTALKTGHRPFTTLFWSTVIASLVSAYSYPGVSVIVILVGIFAIYNYADKIVPNK